MMKKLMKLVQVIMNAYNDFKDYLRYRRAVQMADDAHAKDNDRYYVMPSMDGKLLVMDRKNFRILKKKGYIAKNATIQNAVEECFYFTPRLNDVGMLEPVKKAKYEEYKKWCKAMRMLKYYSN